LALALAFETILLALTLLRLTFAGPVIAGTVIAGTVIALAVVTLAIVTRAFLPGAIIALAIFVLGLGDGFRLGGFDLFRFGLEVDVKAAGRLAANEIGHRPGRLHGPKHPEIVLSVLQMILGQNPIAALGGVASQLLIFLEDALGRATNLDPLGAVGIEGAVGVVLLRFVAAAAAIAAALTLHTLEISHRTPAHRWSGRLLRREPLRL
jgi:hypothetical protein